VRLDSQAGCRWTMMRTEEEGVLRCGCGADWRISVSVLAPSWDVGMVGRHIEGFSSPGEKKGEPFVAERGRLRVGGCLKAWISSRTAPLSLQDG
jgi:hypothetical protein